MGIYESLKTGIIIMLVAVLAFLLLSRGFDYWGKSLSFAGLLCALWLVGKYYFELRALSDLPKVARITIPAMLSEFKRRVDGSNYNAEYFKGYYLVNYRSDALTVAWHKDRGIVAMRTCGLEDFKRVFNPEAAAVPQSVTEQVSSGGFVDVEN